MSVCLFGVETICIGTSYEITLASHLVNIYPGALCVGLVQTLTRALVQEVARLTLQLRRKRTVTSQCQTMSPVTKSRAENLQTSTLFTLILIYLCHFMQDIFHKSPPLFSVVFFKVNIKSEFTFSVNDFVMKKKDAFLLIFTKFGTQPHLNTLHMYNKINCDWPFKFLILLLNFDWLPAGGFFGSKCSAIG